MFKITAIISLLLIGSTLWAASLSCDSCGSECAAACGTRHFRSCCFNYLRRKRGPDSVKLSQNLHDYKPEGLQNPTQQFSEDIPDIWGNVLPNEHSRYYPLEDTYENRYQAMYDA